MFTTTSADAIIERSKAYQEIKGRLRRRLGQQWEPGVRLPPIKDLARQLSTGQTNTHRAVKELVREGFLVSRPGKGTFVTDKVASPGMWTSSLVGGDAARRNTGLLVGRTVEVLGWVRAPDGLFVEINDRFSRALSDEGCHIVRSAIRYNRPVEAHEHAQADGVMVLNPNYRQRLSIAGGQALMVISTSVDLTLPMTGGYDVVMVDSEQGGVVAGLHLRAAGCRRPMFIGCQPLNNTRSEYDLTSLLRLRGFEQGFGEELDLSQRLHLPHYMSSEGAKAVAEFLQLDPRPDGIFAASDEFALGFIHGGLAHGLEPGRDYQIIGFDAQHRSREMTSGPLTSVAIPDDDLARVAATLLTQRLLNPTLPPRRVSLGCHLYQGATTRRVDG